MVARPGHIPTAIQTFAELRFRRQFCRGRAFLATWRRSPELTDRLIAAHTFILRLERSDEIDDEPGANQDFSRAKREAKSGSVIITERGRPANVLMSYDEYKRLTEKPKNLFDLLAMPGQEEVEFEPPPRQKAAPRKIDLP